MVSPSMNIVEMARTEIIKAKVPMFRILTVPLRMNGLEDPVHPIRISESLSKNLVEPRMAIVKIDIVPKFR